jgi:hypothetical protein
VSTSSSDELTIAWLLNSNLFDEYIPSKENSIADQLANDAILEILEK